MADEQLVAYDGDAEDVGPVVSIDDVEVDASFEMSEEEAWAYKIIRRAASLKGVTIKRDKFLRTELAKKCPPDVVKAAVETNPQVAGVPMEIMDELADAAISLETRKVSGLSTLVGIPGGLSMIGTIPADIVQYFAHALRIEQKLAYLYGWESFLNDDDEVDDETMFRLILFLGVMMQVGGVGNSLMKFASQTAKVGVAKTIEKQTLTKTAWFLPLKRILAALGVKNVTKSTFAEFVSKGVPIVGGIISGGITYVSFRPGAVSLKKYLRTLPQATGVILPDEEMEQVLSELEEESKVDFAQAFAEAREKAGEVAGTAAAKAGEVVGTAATKAGEVAGVAATKAGGAAKAVGTGVRKGFDALSSRIVNRRSNKKAADDGTSDPVEQLRALKQMLDEGLITQEDYDAKKREVLGL